MYLPNLINEDLNLESVPQTGTKAAFSISALESFVHGPTSWLATTALTHLFSGRHLTEEEWRNSPYYRKGLSFPHGVGENLAKFRASEFDHENLRQDQLGMVQPGFLTSASKLTGSVIGAALDPINDATAVVASEYIGEKAASATLAHLGESAIARTAARTAIGGVEGTAISAPQIASDFATEHDLGHTESAATVLSSLALGAGLGGVVRGFVGFRQPISTQADRMAKQTAVNQLASGKSVDVEPIVQHGAYTEQLRQSEALEKVNQQVTSHLNEFNGALDERIAEQEAKVSELSDRQQADQLVMGLPDKAQSPLTSADQLEHAATVLDKPGFLQTADEKLLLAQLPKTDEFQRALAIMRKPAFEHTASEKVFLKGMLKNEEKHLLESRLTKHKADINALDEQLSKLSSKRAPRKIERLTQQKKALEAQVAAGQKRLNEINGVKEKLTPLENAQKELSRLRYLKEKAEKLRRDHEANLALQTHKFEPPEPGQLRAHSDKVHSWRGNSAINETDLAAYQDSLEGIPDTVEGQLARAENEVDSLREAGELDKEDEAALNEVAEDESKLKTLTGAIRQAANCLKGAV